jgi:predicted TIM-barrel fold metal-dependent hydrolase
MLIFRLRAEGEMSGNSPDPTSSWRYHGVHGMRLCDAHCHFFSSRFLELLTKDAPGLPEAGRAQAVAARLGWDDPGSAGALADRWAAELDRQGVARAALIASIPGDEESVAAAARQHPGRFVGFFTFNPAAGDVTARLSRTLGDQALQGICLFPAMHKYRLDDERVVEVFEAAAKYTAVVFAHCGVLTVGVRKKLGLPSLFDLRLGDPLALAATASRFPEVPVIVPHFGAGFFREALMATEQCPTIHLDSSSSNVWMKYYPGLALDSAFRQALAVAGPGRVLFGTDSSFFPRGWHRSIHAAQEAALHAAGVPEDDRAQIFGGNFDRLFPVAGRGQP